MQENVAFARLTFDSKSKELYTISHNGYVNFPLEPNGRGFIFNTGDQVTLELDTNTMLLKFTKGGSSCTVSVAVPPAGDQYRFVAYFGSKDDSVEIVA